MASKINIERFREDLKVQGQLQGERCENCRNSDEGDVAAAAINLSALVYLRSMAELKALSKGDIQQFIDGFFDKAGVDEVNGPMGSIRYQRKEKANG